MPITTLAEHQKIQPATVSTQPEGVIPASVKVEVLNRTMNDLSRMRFYRRQYDNRRMYFYRQYVSQRDVKNYPDNVTPRSNTFIPYAFSNVETIVSRVLDAFFSQDPPFETRGRTPNDEPAAQQMQGVLLYMFHKANFQGVFEELTRNIAIYGHAGLKVDWDWGVETVHGQDPIYMMGEVEDPQTGQMVQQPLIDPQTGQPKLIGLRPVVRQVPRACPKFTAIDIYDIMVDPDKRVVAQLTERTLRQLKQEQEVYKAQTGIDLYFPEGLAALESKISTYKNPDEIIIRIAEVWDEDLNSWTITSFGEDYEALSWKDTRASFRAATYTPFRRRVYQGEPVLLWTGPNPFMHKRNPILSTSYVKLPNEVFGLGAIEIISDLNEAMNKFANMIVDNWNLGINKRYAYDVNADIDHEALNGFNVPGGKVGVSGDPNKVIFPLPTHTPEPGDYTLLEVYKGMIEMSSGVSDFYAKGVGSPTNNKTATGISQVIGESNFKFKMFIRNLEMDIFQPVLEMVASLCIQFLPDQIKQMVVQAPEAVPTIFPKSPEGLIGNFNFEVVAANYASNKVIRQRNLMALAQVLGQTPYLDQYEASKELLKAFEIRNPKILKTPQQVQMEQQAQMQQQISMMIFESMLQTESKARLQQSKPVNYKGPDGRPRQKQFEGKIPGAGLSSNIKDFAQQFGANAMGLEGMGEVNEG